MKIKEYRSYFNGLEIEKPFNNKKKYKITTLENDLEVLLISDSEAIQSSASLNISIGSAYDPEDIPGLAHFCEHLLFMGTEKYPEESEYNQFLSQNGGYSNAYTTFKETNFFFEVNNNSLEACLDRFSQFFISPLFDASCTEREMLSVNSEHMNNIQTDSWRISQIERNYSNPNHPYHKFYTGNFETLNVPDIRNHVIEFYNKHYSSNLMKLVILGNESIDILYKWAKQYFSKIENKNLILEEFKEPPLTKEYLMKEIYIKPIMDMSLLIIIFPVPNANKYYKEKPYHYFTHLIGHEGKGSIISYLKSKDLAYSIEVGNSNIIDDFDNFKIEISLTEKGLSNYEEVIEIVFQYIEMLKKEGVQEWIYNELETMSKCIFLYEDKDHNDCLVASLSSGMQINYPRHQILSGPYIVRNFDPGLIEDLLNYFTCENFRYILVNQDLELENTIIDKWYGTEYSIKDIPMDIMKKFKNITINKKLHLPERNKFIPEKININYEIPNMNSSLIPELIKNNDKIRMFYKKDDQFNNPKTNITISFISPQIDGTPLDHLMTIIYVGLFEESISEMAYYASLAGIYYNLTNGLTLSICGYNNHILYYLEKFFTAMITLKFTDKEFYNLKDQLKTAYQNSKYSNSSQYAHSYLSYLLSDNSYLTEDLLKEIDDITPSNIMEFYPKIFSRLFIEGFIHGSLSKSESKIVVNIIEKIFNSKSLSLSKRLQNRCIKLPEGKSYIYKRLHSDGDNPNSAVQYYIEISERTTVDKRAMISLLVNLLDEPCFNYLRTQEQLGYIVTSGRWNMSVTSGIYILVQSEKSCLEIESYIEQFLIEFRNIIEKMDNDDFNRNVKLTMEMFQDKHKTLEDEHSWTWNLISSGFYEFNISKCYLHNINTKQNKN
ncbi:a-pheromone processing metallopeptidase-like protein Ste23 [Neocallimastix sp. 'constans']